MKRTFISDLVVAVLCVGAGIILAQGHGEEQGHSHASAEIHGGIVVMTEYHHFEVVIHKHEIRIYAYTGRQKPINDLGEKISGTVELRWRGRKRVKVPLEYIGPDKKAKQTQGYLLGKYDFSDLEEGSVKAKISIDGLAHPKEPRVTFRQAVKLTPEVSEHKPKHGEHSQHKQEEEEHSQRNHDHNDHDH